MISSFPITYQLLVIFLTSYFAADLSPAGPPSLCSSWEKSTEHNQNQDIKFLWKTTEPTHGGDIVKEDLIAFILQDCVLQACDALCLCFSYVFQIIIPCKICTLT